LGGCIVCHLGRGTPAMLPGDFVPVPVLAGWRASPGGIMGASCACWVVQVAPGPGVGFEIWGLCVEEVGVREVDAKSPVLVVCQVVGQNGNGSRWWQ
jgi:hypothetical protein